MTTEEIIKLARKAGGYDGFTSPPTDWNEGDFVISPEGLLKFATLIRNATLEEAAEEADRWQTALHDPRYECDCATAIRALKEEQTMTDHQTAQAAIERLRIESQRETHEPIWRDAIDEIESLRAEVEHVRAVLREQRQRDEALLRQAFDALFWTTGSDDFSEGGLAREGAIKILFPTIAAIHERLKEEQTMTDHQTAQAAIERRTVEWDDGEQQ